MATFTVWTRVERAGRDRFIAKATATPYDVEQRCAPEERSIVCASLEKAQVARVRLAEALCHDIAARGNRVIEPDANDGGEPSPRSAAPAARDQCAATNA